MVDAQAITLGVNVTAGALLAMILGAAATRTWPKTARAAGPALGGLALGLAALVLAGQAIEPVAALVLFAFCAAAWATAPLEQLGASERRRALGWGVAAAALLHVFTRFDLWWTIPIAGLLAGLLRASWNLRGAVLPQRQPPARTITPRPEERESPAPEPEDRTAEHPARP